MFSGNILQMVLSYHKTLIQGLFGFSFLGRFYLQTQLVSMLFVVIRCRYTFFVFRLLSTIVPCHPLSSFQDFKCFPPTLNMSSDTQVIWIIPMKEVVVTMSNKIFFFQILLLPFFHRSLNFPISFSLVNYFQTMILNIFF